MGCHFLLQCMKVKSEREGAQSCPTLRDPMDCSPPGSSVHGVFQARVLEWGAIAVFNQFGSIQAAPSCASPCPVTSGNHAPETRDLSFRFSTQLCISHGRDGLLSPLRVRGLGNASGIGGAVVLGAHPPHPPPQQAPSPSHTCSLDRKRLCPPALALRRSDPEETLAGSVEGTPCKALPEVCTAPPPGPRPRGLELRPTAFPTPLTSMLQWLLFASEIRFMVSITYVQPIT